MAASDDANNISRLFGANPSAPTFLNPFNTSRPNDMTSATPFSSHFTFTGGPFLPPSSSQTTNNSSFVGSSNFGSISPQQYKSPPLPTGNLDTRLPIIPTPPPPTSAAAAARQTYATSTPGLHRHTSNESVSQSSHHHATAMHAPYSDGGPPFLGTEPLHRLYLPGTMAGTLTLTLRPKVDRGFFVASEDSEWTCYRRNYFQLSLAYSLSSQNPALSNEALLAAGIMVDFHGREERVTGFKLTIGARVFGSDLKIIDLVQHTPKRDKGPQLKPALNLMLPGGDVERHAHHDATDTDEEKAALSGNIADGVLPRVVTYERIQFKQATANNGKRRAAQQYFSLIVEAYAVVLGPHGPEEIRVAISRSNPVVVRGRSPGHYSDNPPEVSGPKRPAEITTSTSFLRNEQPSPTSLKSTPSLPPLPTNSTPTSLTPTIPLQNQDTEATQPSQPGVAHDLDFLASLEADFDGYQYLPFTLLDPQGKIVVPHDLFYDPHEFPDTHYANLFQSDPNMTFPNDPVATSFNTQQPADTEFTNLYQGFFDFPPQSDTTWSASTTMGRAPSNSGHISSPFPKDRSNSSQQGTLDGNWFDTFQANSQGVGYRPTGTTPFMFPQNDNNGGKWMFEFRNSSYGYFPNLPAVGDS